MGRKTSNRSKMSRRKPSRKNTSLGFEQLEVRRFLAADLPSFAAEAGLYQIFSNQGQVGQVDLESQSFETTTFNAGTKVNAAGFRTADNYAYGVVTSVSQIARIGSNGEIDVLGSVEGLPTDKGTYYVGDFANDDLIYLRNSGQKNILYGVNVDTLEVDNIIKTSTPLDNIYDIAFNNGDEKFYASQRGTENVLISIDLDGNVEKIGNNGVGKLTFGAMYADADGNIFGGANQTGDVYRFDKVTGAAVVVGHGPTSGTNDGFSNAAAVLELAPLAIDDVFTMDSTTVTTGNLFSANGNQADIDPNDDSFVVSAINGNEDSIGTTVQLDSGSTLAVSSTGQFIYNPSSEYTFLELGESATDSVEYTITDSSGRSSTATLTVNVDGEMAISKFTEVRVTGLNSFGGSQYGYLSDVGDLNGDGFTDGAVALPAAKGGSGLTFVVYGTAEGIEDDFNVNRLRFFNGNDGSLGTVFYGVAANDQSGSDFSAAGDINGDGFGDLLIGAKDADANGVKNSGQTYVLFGSQKGFGPEFKLASLTAAGGGNGSLGFVVNGIGAHDLSGSTVTSIGDFNADGVDDFAIAAAHADADADRKNSGQTFIIYGNKKFDAELELSSLRTSNGGDGSQGVVINGVRKHDLAGGHIAGGDFDADGVADLLITAYNADPDGMQDAGQSYVIYGSSNGIGSEFELSSLLIENNKGGKNGFAINGNSKTSHEGSFVDLRDFDGDGFADLLVGVGNDNATASGVLFGGSKELIDQIDFSQFDTSAVFLDNFDQATDYDQRSWDSLTYSATLHSANGTQVSIWGDPHVVINIGGNVELFDIGYGAGTIKLEGGTVINWDTFSVDDPRFPLGPPLKSFSVTNSSSVFDISVDTEDGENSVGNLTSLSESQLLDFARQLRQYEGDASKPLAKK